MPPEYSAALIFPVHFLARSVFPTQRTVLCSAYISRVPRLREMFLSQRQGFMGAFFKFRFLPCPTVLCCILPSPAGSHRIQCLAMGLSPWEGSA